VSAGAGSVSPGTRTCIDALACVSAMIVQMWPPMDYEGVDTLYG
jgi:hypothetical protein